MTFIPKNHDLNLPVWGPYSKRYAGISHIPDVQSGLRFDLTLLPGRFRGQMLVPNEKWASGHHTWEAASDFRYYSYRYEIEWKDRVFCDTMFAALNADARLLRCRFVNNTDLAQNLMLHLIGFLNFPPVTTYSDEPLQPGEVSLPAGGMWIDGLDYDDLQFATPRPTDNLVEDGRLRAEIRDHGLVGGSGIGDGFGQEAGDWVEYTIELGTAIPEAALTLRWRGDGRFHLSGLVDTEIQFPAAADLTTRTIPVGPLSAGRHTLRLTSCGDGALTFDGFALTAANESAAVEFSVHRGDPVPQILPGPTPQSIILQYAALETVYGLAWDQPDFWLRQYFHDEIDMLLPHLVPNNYSPEVHGDGDGHFTDIFIRPITLPAQSKKLVDGLVCQGDLAAVREQLVAFAERTTAENTAVFTTARKTKADLSCLPAGEPYRFSQERMAATELINVVYPVYTRRQYIRHHTPGKWWDCLYTWDSGFIGIALLEYDRQRAIDCLQTYLTPPGDSHNAFIHHGSPVPTQLYLFQEIWNRSQDQEFLAAVYPSLRQTVRFLAGSSAGSTTRELASNLLRTWEICPYESGGWDDYPAQLQTLEHEDETRITCAAITAHLIRSYKILRAAARELGLAADAAEYSAEIALLTAALQEHAWDAEAGVFSYVVHDEDGRPTHFLRDENGINFNHGLDGIMPLIAGVCTPAQETLFLDRLADPRHYWTPIGLSTVDQSAPYYRNDGYWNGAVWFPHQWFIWKTALDLGRSDFAAQIAATALDLWRREVDASYYCFEHFIIENGRGAGWHQFGGLSSPVAAWYGAYHRPGRLSVGFDIWVEGQTWGGDGRSLSTRLRHTDRPRPTTVLVNLQAGTEYTALWNDQPIPATERYPGALEMTLPFDVPVGELRVQVVNG